MIAAVATPMLAPYTAAFRGSRPAPAVPGGDTYHSNAFAGGVDWAADSLLKLEGRLGGAIGAVEGGTLAAQGVMKLAGVTGTVTLSGGLGAIGLVSVLAVAGALGYAGWQAGGWVAGQAVQLSNRMGDAVARKSGSRGLGDAARILPKVALAVGVACTGSIGVDGSRLSLGLPAAGFIGGAGLVRALDS